LIVALIILKKAIYVGKDGNSFLTNLKKQQLLQAGIDLGSGFWYIGYITKPGRPKVSTESYSWLFFLLKLN